MKVVLIRPGQVPEVGELNGIDEMCAFVGGSIECVPYSSNMRIVCNDEFLLNGSPLNCLLGGTVYYGNIFICGIGYDDKSGERDLIGLTDAQINSLSFIPVDAETFDDWLLGDY